MFYGFCHFLVNDTVDLFQTTQDNVDEAVAILNNIVSGQEFRAWELTDNVPRLQFDIAALSPQVIADLLVFKHEFI